MHVSRNSASRACCSRSRFPAPTTRARARGGYSSGAERAGKSSPTGTRPTNPSPNRSSTMFPRSMPRRRRFSRATARKKAERISAIREVRSPPPGYPQKPQPFGESCVSIPKASTATEAAAMFLSVNNIEVVYSHVILVLKGISLDVPRGGIVALLGANGAGKTTTLKAVSNLLHAERGEVTKGSILFDGVEVQSLSPNDLVRRGCIQVMEGRRCFAHLTVEENLLTGAFTRRDGKSAIAQDLERVYAYFPRLRERRGSTAGYTSGGEQQMCVIGRALMSRPKMILLDEPSMGLAPQIVEEIFEIVKDLNLKEGVSFLLAEQNTNMALKYASHGYILENGRVVMDGEARALAANEDVKEFYLGIAGDNRNSFRDVKHYKRRKRWLI